MKKSMIGVIQRFVSLSFLVAAFACAVRPAAANQLYSGYFTDNSGCYSCDTTTYPTTTNIVTRPELANKCRYDGSYDEYRTTVYWGEMYFAAGTYRFAGTFDDYIWVKVNGNVVLSRCWDYGVAYGNVTIPVSGWYPVEFRFHNNGNCQADTYYHDSRGWACSKCLCIQNITSNPSSTDTNPDNFTVVGLDANGNEISNIFRLPTTVSSLYNGLVAWYKFDGNANDSSGNGNHGTVNGATPTTDRFGNANGAYQFGSGKYIQVPDSSSLRSFSSSITMSAWIRPDSWYSSTWLAILCKGTSSGSHGFDFKLDVAGRMCTTESFEGLGGYVGYSPSLDFGSWQLVTVTHDGSTACVYVNGMLRGTRAFSVGTLNYANDLMIGVDRPGSTEYYYGAMDDLRIYNRALSAAEVAALYSGTDTTSARGYVQTGLMGQWDGIENAGYGVHDSSASTWVDLSGHGYNATKQGSYGEWKDNSFVFTRSGTGYFSTPSGFQSTLGSSWTIEAYVKPTAAARSNYAGICGGHTSYGVAGVSFQSWSSGLAAFVNHYGSNWPGAYLKAIGESEEWPTGKYVHLAYEIDNATGEEKVLKNGVLVASRSFSASTAPSLGCPYFWIGRAFDEYNRQFDGNIYAVRAYNRALSAAEIAQNYALDQRRFSGLIHRWSFNGSLADSVGGATARNVGSSSIQYTADGKSLSLPGGSHGTSGVDLGANLLPTDGTPVTIEIWAKNRVAKNQSRVLDMGSGASYSGPSDAFLMSWSDGTDTTSEYIHAYDGGSRVVTQSGCLAPYTLGTEYHISVVFEPNRDGDSKMAITCVKRNASTGSILRQYSFKSSAAWSLASLTQSVTYLGRSEWTADQDASADYNEVRIWNRALSEAELTRNAQLGPDVLPYGYVEPTPSPLATALNTTETVTTGGDANWFVQTSETHDGVSAARSGDVNDSQQTWMETTVEGPAEISFWWKVDSEGSWDWLRFAIDGNEQYAISGYSSGSYYYCTGGDRETRVTGVYNGGWEKRIVTIGSGSHTLKWSYTKDGSGSPGSDCGWVDQLVVNAGPYIVRYNKNDGSGTTATQSFEVGETKSLLWLSSGLGWSYSGYNFLGWALSPSSTTIAYSNGQSVKDVASSGSTLDLYALWQFQGYTVRYHKNDGSATTLDQSILRGASRNLYWMDSQIGWKQTGYTFQGWARSASATTVGYTNGQKVTNLGAIGATVDLYAVWKPITYTVRFHKNDGTTTTMDQVFTYDKAQNLLYKDSQLKWNPTGLSFAGWARTASGAKVYENGQRITTNLATTQGAVVHLYAIWNYTVTLKRNTSTSDKTSSSVTCRYGSTASIPWMSGGLKWSRTGYAFTGWGTGVSSSVAYANGAKATGVTTSTTLYAQWKPITYTVRYHRRNTAADTTTRDQVHTYDQPQRLLYKDSGLKWDNAGFNFLGWATTTNSTTARFANGQSVTNLCSTQGAVYHLYALWQGKPYTIRLNKNDGSGTKVSQMFRYHTAQRLPYKDSGLGWSRTGYDFLGWARTAGATKAEFANGQSVTDLAAIGATIDLYAVWKAHTYTIVLNYNDGKSDLIREIPATYGQDVQLPWGTSGLKWVPRTGKSFLGWATSRTATTATYANGAKVKNLMATNGGVVELHAVWK